MSETRHTISPDEKIREMAATIKRLTLENAGKEMAARAYSARANAAEAELAKAMEALEGSYTDETGNVWSRPTAWAYFAVCRTRDNLAAELAKAREALTRVVFEQAASGLYAASMPHDMREQCRTVLVAGRRK